MFYYNKKGFCPAALKRVFLFGKKGAPAAAPAFAGLSERAADIVLLAQALGAASKALWHSGLSNADVVGFLYVGGDIAGLFAYFFFVCFGLLFFYRHAGYFWRGLHPLNFGLAMLLFSAPRAAGVIGFGTSHALLALAGGGLAAAAARWVAAHPRRFLMAAGALLFAAALWRYAAPALWQTEAHNWRFWARPFAAVCGGFLFALPVALLVLRRRAAK